MSKKKMPIETERSKTVNRNILPPYVRISTNQIAFQSWLTVLSDWYLLPCVCGLRLICEESVVCVVRDLGIREVMGAMAKKRDPKTELCLRFWEFLGHIRNSTLRSEFRLVADDVLPNDSFLQCLTLAEKQESTFIHERES